MTRKDCLKAYAEYSAQASVNVRQLGLGGIALIWLFKASVEANSIILPSVLLWAGAFIIAALLLDFFQYTAGAAIWSGFNRLKEKAGVPLEQDFKAPRWINWSANTLFWGKVGCTITGYGFLLWHFVRVLRVQ